MTVADALDNAKTFESWASDYYEPAALKHYDQVVGRMLRLVAPPPGGTIFDAGCGTGVHSIRAAKAGFKVQSVDISAVALDTARRKATEAGVANQISFEQGDLTNLRFADASFDALFTWGVLSHIPDVDRALKELVRVLKPGSRIAIQSVNGHALDHLVEGFARFVLRKPIDGLERSRFGVGSWCDMHGGRLYNWRFNFGAITKALAELNCRRIHRSASEFTELQRRVGHVPRWLLRQANNAWAALHLPAGPAVTNILVFEKAK